MGHQWGDYALIEKARRLIGRTVSLRGIILDATIPRMSMGTDYYCVLKIIDKSCPKNGLTVMIFSGTMDKLPRVHYGGDIVMLTNFVMKNHQGKIYAEFNKKSSSFALFEGKYGTSFSPYHFCAYDHVNEYDKRFILELREWLIGHQIATGLSGEESSALSEEDSSVFKSLKDIKEGAGFNLVCKILHVWEVEEDKWMLLVWDGTDTPPCSINSSLKDEMAKPLPLQSGPVCLPRDVICGLPPLGTVLRVTMDCANEEISMNVLEPNRWVKFDYLQCQLNASLWHASLLTFSRFCYLRDEDDIVLQRTRKYDERWLSNRWVPHSSLLWPIQLTVTDHRDDPVTLISALAHNEVICKYHCVVRVVTTCPGRVEGYFSRRRRVYRVRLTLEDPTARIHAYLCGADAEKFFGNDRSLDVLTRKMNKLLGISESDGDREMNGTSRNPPWIMCCLKSYYTDASDMLGSKKFAICDTTLGGVSE